MADFNAGSIQASMDLDLTPFEAGLEKARAQAAEFASKDSTSTAKVKVDTGASTEKTDAVQEGLDKVDGETAKAKVEVSGIAGAIAGLTALEAALDKVNGSPGGAGGMGGHGMMALIGLAASVAPALAPAGAALTLFGSAALAGMAQAGIGIGLFAKVAMADIKDLQTATKNGLTLTGPAGEAQKAIAGLSAAWDQLKKATGPAAFGFIAAGAHDLADIIPRLVPLVDAVGAGLQKFLVPLHNFTVSPAFQNFINMIAKNAVPALKELGQALTNFLHGAINLIEGLNPVTGALLSNINGLSKSFLTWSQNMKNGGIQEVFNFIKDNGPQTSALLHDLFSSLGSLLGGLAPLIGPALGFLDGFVKAVGTINLAPLAKGVGDVLTGLTPFFQVIADLVNTILPPFAALLGTIAKDSLGPLGKSLSKELVPAFKDLGHFLDLLAPVLGDFVASIANLVNPTGVALFTSILQHLLKAVEPMIKPLGNLAVAIESLVDNGLTALIPLIGPFGGLVTVLIDMLVPVVNVAAALLSMKPVADILIGIYAAIKVWGLISGIVAIVTGAMEGFALAVGGAALAEDASAVSSGVYTAVLVAQAVATGAAAAATWLLDAALAVLTSPITLVVVAAAALVVGLILLYKHSSLVRDIVNYLWTDVKKLAGLFATEFVTVLHAVVTAFDFVKDHIKLFLLLIGGPLAVGILAVIEIIKHWSSIVSAVRSAWDSVMSFLSGIPGRIKGIFAAAGSWLLSAGHSIMTGLHDGITNAYDAVTHFLGTVKGDITGVFSGAIGWLSSAGNAIVQGLWDGIDAVWTGLIHHLESLAGGIPKVVKLVLGVNSPARVMIPVGSSISEGLHVGFVEHFQGTFLPYLNGIGDQMTNALSGLSAPGSLAGALSGNVQMSMATSYTDQMATVLAGVLDQHLSTQRQQDQQTQQDTTDALTKAFTAASTAQADKMAVIQRKGSR